MGQSLARIALICSAIIGISACATTEPRPRCDFRQHDAQHAAALQQSESRLAPIQPGSFTEMPLNYANVVDPGIIGKILVQSTGALRDIDGSLEIQTRLVNCTDFVLQVEGRAQFFDEAQRQSEPPTAWTRMVVQGRTFQTYRVRSTLDNAASYLIELREGS